MGVPCNYGEEKKRYLSSRIRVKRELELADGTEERTEAVKTKAESIEVIHRGKLVQLSRQHGITFLGLFGSFAKGTATETSDVDLVARFAERKSLLDLVRIERELSEALSRKVDLLTEASVSPHLRARVEREMVVLYEEEQVDQVL